MSIQIKYNTLLDEWREEAVEKLDRGFEKHLTHADTVFLDFADKAENINVQNHFFEAQREIWLKAEQLKRAFHDQLVRTLFEFPGTAESLCEEMTRHQQEDDLALLDMEEYDKKLALQAIADQFERNHYQPIFALQQRLTVVNHSRPISTKQILASPHQICCIYSHCADDLIMEKEALLVLYTVFEKEIMKLLPGLYESLNEHLVGAGILPSLKYTFKKAAHNGPPVPPRHPESTVAGAGGGGAVTSGQTTSGGEEGFETLHRVRELLSAGREKLHPKQPLPKGVQPATNQEVIHTVTAVSDVSASQFPDEIQLSAPDEYVAVNKTMLTRVQSVLKQQREQIKEQTGPNRLQSSQEDVIDVVGMLFEQMLDDEQIPGRAQALLSHLHTPYIKIGLHDEDFLNNEEHPARRFFNKAVEASESWINERDLEQGVYPQLKDIVFKIVKFRKQQDSDFEQYHVQLETEIDRLGEKAQLVEKRSLEAEKGRSQLQHAKELAISATNELFGGSEISADCQEFIDSVWIDYLTLLLLRNDGLTENQDWQDASELAENILDISQQAVTGKATSEQIETLSSSIMGQVGTLLPHQHRAIEKFIMSLSQEEPETVTVKIVEVDKAIMEQAESPEHEGLFAELRALVPGTWFIFDADTDNSDRGKLSWYNEYSHRFFFVDMAGKKLALKHINELTTEIIQGKTVYFHEVEKSFWSKAMKAIRKLLEKNINPAT